MNKINMNIDKKNYWFMAAAAVLQILSSFLFIAAAMGVMKDIKHSVKQILIQELSK